MKVIKSRKDIKSLKILIAIFALIITSNVKAQDKTVKKIDQEWAQYYAGIKIAKAFTLSADGGYRFNKLFNDPSQYIVRAGLGYQLNSHMKVAAGFAHLGFYTSEKISKLEYRPYRRVCIKRQL